MRFGPAVESFFAAFYIVLVLANVGGSVLGIYSCSVLLEVRLRPSVRWGRFGFLWNLAAVTLIASMGWPLPLVCMFLLLFLGAQILAAVGFWKDLRRRMDRMKFGSPHRHEEEWEPASERRAADSGESKPVPLEAPSPE